MVIDTVFPSSDLLLLVEHLSSIKVSACIGYDM